jgi:hypothetical protein
LPAFKRNASAPAFSVVTARSRCTNNSGWIATQIAPTDQDGEQRYVRAHERRDAEPRRAAGDDPRRDDRQHEEEPRIVMQERQREERARAREDDGRPAIAEGDHQNRMPTATAGIA